MNLNQFYFKEFMKAHKKTILLSLLAVGLLVAAFYVSRAQAATVTLSATYPTQNVDLTPIPASGAGSIVGLRFEWGSCNGTSFGTKAGEVSTSAPATSAVSPDLPPGAYCFRAFAKNTYGTESDASNVVAKTVLTPKPGAPVLSVSNPVAYDVHFKNFRLVLGNPIGTVPLGTVCIKDARLSGTDYYAVPYKAVTVTARTRSPVFLAKCALS